MNKPSSMFIVADFANMRHAEAELSAAVKELKTTHALRIARYLQ